MPPNRVGQEDQALGIPVDSFHQRGDITVVGYEVPTSRRQDDCTFGVRVVLPKLEFDPDSFE